ncbi:MAG: VCBS repeat-containing protein [Akkermansiaceae bacterium]|jgi:hypothetical protein|nr:VCBS repeat-containing protein [Akkermansiaceae bacterium]
MRRLVLSFIVLCQTGQSQVTFAPPKSIVPTLRFMDDLRVHDINADSHPDLIAVELYGHRTLTWLNDENGNFSNPLEWSSDDEPLDYLGLADWNQDGQLDLWFSGEDSENPSSPSGDSVIEILVAPGLGGGNFGQKSVIGTMPQGPSFSGDPILMDINGDGRADVLTESSILLSNPGGGWAATGQGLPKLNSQPLWLDRRTPRGNDHDGDGDVDLFIVPDLQDGRLLFWENLGGGAFATPRTLLGPTAEGLQRQHFQMVPDSGGAAAITVETQSMSGQSTVVRYTIDSTATLVPNGQFTLPVTREGKSVYNTGVKLLAPDRAIVASYSGDLNRTYLDLIRFDGSPLVPVMTVPGATTTDLIQLENLNGDVYVDLLLGLPALQGVGKSVADQVHWIAMNSAGAVIGGFREVHTSVVAPVLEDSGDLNGDGKPDILVGSAKGGELESSHILHFFSTDNTGETWTETRTVLDAPLQIFGRIDLVGSYLIMPAEYTISAQAGKADFLVLSTDEGTSRFGWLIQDANRVFHFFPLTESNSSWVHHADLQDWDGDGINDILFVETGYLDNRIKWHKGTITGFLPSMDVAILSTLEYYSSPVIDMDRDGDLDLLFQGNLFGQHSCYWMENDGAGNLIAARRLQRLIWSAGVDFDQDGFPDFGVSSHHGGPGQILLSRPGLTFEPFGAQIFRPESTHFLDMDDDGDADMLSLVPFMGLAAFTEILWFENRGDGFFSEPRRTDGPSDRYRSNLSPLDIDQDGVTDLVSISPGDGRIEWFQKTRVAAPATFESWMAASNLSGHSAGPFSDWDEDGASNWEEFAFGSHPASPDPGHPGRPRMVHLPSGLAYRFQRRTDASALGLGYQISRSNDLRDWFPWSPVPAIQSGPHAYESVSYPIEPGSGPEFFRTEISDPAAP